MHEGGCLHACTESHHPGTETTYTIAMLLSQLAMALALMAAATVVTLVWQWQRVEKFLRWVAMVVLTKKLRAKVSIDALILRAWSFEMHGLLISNGPGAWEAPYALQLPRLRVEFTCCMGLLSTIFPPTLRLGRYEFHLGFRIKAWHGGALSLEGLFC